MGGDTSINQFIRGRLELIGSLVIRGGQQFEEGHIGVIEILPYLIITQHHTLSILLFFIPALSLSLMIGLYLTLGN